MTDNGSTINAVTVYFEQTECTNAYKSHCGFIHDGHAIQMRWLRDIQFVEQIETPKFADTILENIPEEESPSNILNKLNYDCLEAISRCPILDARDLLALAMSCTSFEFPASKALKRELFKADEKHNEFDWTKPFYQNIQHLQTFGHSFTTLNLENCSTNKIMVGLINRYCSRLKYLRIHASAMIDRDGRLTSEMMSVMSRLEEISISGISNGAGHGNNVTTLHFPRFQCPQLTKIELKYIQCLDDSSITPFLIVNPQLRALKMLCCEFERTFDYIANNLPSLEELEVYGRRVSIDVSTIGRLKRLKKLRVPFNDVWMDRAIEIVLTNGLPLEHIDIQILPNDVEAFLNKLNGIPTLKSIYFTMPTGNELVQIARHLPNLTKLGVVSGGMEFEHVLQILQVNGSQLTDFEAKIHPTHLDIGHVDAIAEIVEKRSMRLKVTVFNINNVPVSVNS